MIARKIYGAGLTGQPAGVHLDVQLYSGNRRIALRLTDANDGMPYGMLTANVPQVELAEDEFVVQAGWILPTDLKASFLASGLFEAVRQIPDGTGRAEVQLEGNATDVLADIFDADGTAVVVHEGPDDYRTDPAGDAGSRIACGVIKRV